MGSWKDQEARQGGGMTPLRQALGAAYPLPAMDQDTVRSISAGLARIERKEEAERIAAPMRELFDMIDEGTQVEIRP